MLATSSAVVDVAGIELLHAAKRLDRLRAVVLPVVRLRDSLEQCRVVGHDRQRFFVLRARFRVLLLGQETISFLDGRLDLRGGLVGSGGARRPAPRRRRDRAGSPSAGCALASERLTVTLRVSNPFADTSTFQQPPGEAQDRPVALVVRLDASSRRPSARERATVAPAIGLPVLSLIHPSTRALPAPVLRRARKRRGDQRRTIAACGRRALDGVHERSSKKKKPGGREPAGPGMLFRS